MLADVVVAASSTPEAFGRVIAEAQAMGRPVVATDHGGAREQLSGGRMAWLTPLESAPALATAIDEALSLPVAERELLAPSAIANVRLRFAKDAMCQRTLLVYRELAGSRSEEHTSELQSLMRNSYAVFCLKTKKPTQQH